MNKEERLTAVICGYAHGKAFIPDNNGGHLSKVYSRGVFDATALVEKLADYENTNLSPAEIKELQKQNAELKARLEIMDMAL